MSSPSRVPVALFATAAGVLITNLFAPQILVRMIADSFALRTSSVGVVAMVPLLGYALGLFFLVPLADVVETRRLVLRLMAVGIAATVAVVFVREIGRLYALLFVAGAACASIQVLVPAAAAMTPPERRGRVIGDIMSGLMVGILLSRPIASFLGGTFGWRTFYVASASTMLLLAVLLALRLPDNPPRHGAPYGALIGSLWQLFQREEVLRRRSVSAAIMMAAFNLFWTTIVYVLGGAPFNLGPSGIALFALVGAGGAIVTPVVGRWSDRGLADRVTSVAHIVLILGFGLAAAGVCWGAVPKPLMLLALGVSAVLLDMGVLADQTAGRYLINLLEAEARGRINGIFVGVFFIGGAVGSALSGMLWSTGGWPAVCAAGASLGLLAFMTRKPTALLVSPPRPMAVQTGH